MLVYLLEGVSLGLAGGLAPGPLITLVVSESLKHGRTAGFKVALAPFITDIPIITVLVALVASISQYHVLFGAISILGALFLLVLARENLMTREFALETVGPVQHPLRKGALVNVLNFHPYFFWFAVGAPTVVSASNSSIPSAAAFIVGFYIGLTGSNFTAAMAAHAMRERMAGRYIARLLQGLGLVMIVLAILLFREGLQLITG